LHLVGHVNVGTNGDIKPPRADSLLSLLWPIVEPDFHARFDPDRVHGGDEDGNVLVEPLLRRIAANWQLPEVRYLSQHRDETKSGQAEHRVEYHWVGSDARLAGTVVHRWLQRCADGRMRLDADGLATCAATSEKWLREMGASDAIVKTVAARVTRAMQNVVEDPQGRALLKGGGATELALTGLVDGQVESIVIDRVHVDESGQHWIIDYKTSTHEGGNLEGFLAAECDRYRPQLRKYATIYSAYSGVPVRCALYFPLLGRLVELPEIGVEPQFPNQAS
jgi:ATP-dependent exoDNAse (exonuclease V) beta subunit